ncbi:hypothetical protein EHV15_35810 [Paenibacillus oralis]|uniref:Uncharacterized protein n=1 Tax=Paenibacillus oralis TaxID=2490856 RepID=A0A3P3TBP4_9BACL|nr:hypothetical protein [Paenibacillus oralis]RRJ54939.1 hypothetical protein EHV15_35810 [Paenibacillus oralis]
MIKQNLQIFEMLDSLELECDGLSRVISSLLSSAGVSHRLFIGSVTTIGNKGMCPHLWIEVDDYVIDYRLRMWLGHDPSIPHGVFKKSEFSHITYSGSVRDSYGDRDLVAQIFCSMAGIKYEDIAFKLKESLQGAV